MIRPYLLAFLALSTSLLSHAQLTVTTAPTPQQLVQDVLLGGGVTATNVTYIGNAQARGSFTTGTSNLGLGAGVILSTGRATEAANPANFFANTDLNPGLFPAPTPDADLQAISGLTIYDRSVLEFDFVPTGDTLRFRYVFGSEEYPQFTCSSWNDAFGFFLSGPGIAGPFTNGAINLAVVPGTNTPITINSVNSGSPSPGNSSAECVNSGGPNWAANSIYYVNNIGGTTVAYDGFTVVMTAFALVQCGETYHIKLAIGDGGDGTYDSGVFLEAGSFASTGQVVPEIANGFGADGSVMLEGCGPYEFVFTRQGDLSEESQVILGIGGSAVPGVDYSPAFPDTLSFAAEEETITVQLDVPILGTGPRNITIVIDQLSGCSAGQVIEFEFTIDSAPQLVLNTTDVGISCGQSATLGVQVSGGLGFYTYQWNTGETTPTITVSPTSTTTYSVTVDDLCGVVPATAEVTVNLPDYEPIVVEASPPTFVDCLGTGPIEVISVTGGDSTYTYQWTLNGVVLGTAPVLVVPSGEPTWYLVTATDGCGATGQDSVLVSTTPLPPIEITTTADVTVICPGDTVTIGVLDIIGGNGVYTLEWTNASGVAIGVDYLLDVGVLTDQTYTVTVNDQCGYSASATATTLLPNYAPFALQLTEDMLICAGDSAVLQAVVTGGSGYYVVDWGSLGHSDPVLFVQPMDDTEYVVSVTDRCGAVLMDRVVVKVEHVYTSIVVTNRGQDDWYLQAATTPYAQTWLWDMGDGARYRGNEVIHSYFDLEEHWVTLKIVTPNGCTGVDSVLLRPPAQIFFPNAFTPDGDGINDVFGPVGNYIEDFEMTIFDRWGNEVFTTRDMTVPWDGRVRGASRAVNGVYVYKYRAVGHLFPAVEGYGHVTLIAGSQD